MRFEVCVLAAATLASACAANPASPRYTGSPDRYLLRLDQLASPDFTAVEPPHPVDLLTLAGGDAAQAVRLRANGFSRAARVGYFRQADLTTSNGPLEAVATVEAFTGSAGAHRSYASDVEARDRSAGEVPTSAGPLGDEAHADSDVSNALGSVPVVQITLEWRVANLVETIVLRGRYGGTRLGDALLLAQRMVDDL